MNAKRITAIGLVGTAVYLFAIVAYSIHSWSEIVSLKPNALGDFLAGSFGPLALFWLVCGYFQQGVELRQNTNVLRMQASELENSTRALEHQVLELKRSVDQQTVLAETTQKQLAIETERHEAAKRQEKLQDFADLTLRYNPFGRHAPAIGEVEVINTGVPFTIVDIASNGDGDEFPDMHKIDTGGTFRFTPYRSKPGHADRHLVQLTIDYRGPRGLKGTFIIEMKLQPDETYSIDLKRENESN